MSLYDGKNNTLNINSPITRLIYTASEGIKSDVGPEEKEILTEAGQELLSENEIIITTE